MKKLILSSLVAASLLTGCAEKSDTAPAPEPTQAAAVQPVAEAAPAKTEIPTPDITISSAPEDIKKGEETFTAKGCGACHKVGGGRLVGPDLKGVTARRDQEWIEKMILRPDVMVKEDETAKKLLGEYFTPMPNQGVDAEKDLPAILAFLKANE
jgi:mono/diheme cytochrome c family protein